MILTDYHMHSISPDARTPMRDMCRAALERGLREIAITDHMEMYSPGYQGKEKLLFGRGYMEDYFRQLAQCREEFAGRLTVRAGVELGQPLTDPRRAEELLRDFHFDFVLGSLHKIHDVDLCFKAYSSQNLPGICRDYLEKQYELVDTGDFDVLGHADLVKRYAFRQGFAVDVMDYRDQAAPMLERLAQRGKGLEINTSGLRQGLGDTLPGLGLLKLFRQLGGQVLTVGSDAHRPQDVGQDFETARQMALEAGFTQLAVFENREPSFYSIT